MARKVLLPCYQHFQAKSLNLGNIETVCYQLLLPCYQVLPTLVTRETQSGQGLEGCCYHVTKYYI